MIRPASLPILVSVCLAACSTLAPLHEPLPNASHRATPLHYGLHVTSDPAENPIDPPERFTGYHVGTDYEVSTGELEGDVPVYAICDGRVVYSGFVGGYGGLLAQRCWIDSGWATVLYGHMALEGLPEEGTDIEAGDTIGLLGANRSYDTDGNRKHLHLGIRRGSQLDFRGYVQTEEDLVKYIDPQTVLSQEVIDLPGQSPGETPFWQAGSSSDSGQ